MTAASAAYLNEQVGVTRRWANGQRARTFAVPSPLVRAKRFSVSELGLAGPACRVRYRGSGPRTLPAMGHRLLLP
jgi:hypothetical protein